MRLCYSALSCQKVFYFNYFLNQARRYDTRTTIFSPEGNFYLNILYFLYKIFICYFIFTGRLYQVEYAMEAISHAGTCLGILANDGILLTAERKNTNKLLDGAIFSEKIYKLNE